MVKQLDHVAIIVSKEDNLEFYKKLGFLETKRIERGYDTVVIMECGDIVLELFVDDNHPKRVTNPEMLGLRHLALKVDDIQNYVGDFGITEIKKDWSGVDFAFINDPDGLPIELHE